jgi:aarF domain-containing kinase
MRVPADAAAPGCISYLFPDFEFSWLAGEMRENLPKELDFAHEARNAARAAGNFAHTRTALYVPRVLRADRRVLVMEFIRGGRVDDLAYLAEHAIDRNAVALELAKVFAKMVHQDGFFHGVGAGAAIVNCGAEWLT